jgi:6-phosphogluconolactonase
MGDDPCHLSLDHTANFIVATNYTSGSAIVYKLVSHLPTQVHSFIVHEGHGPNPDRQASAHCHSSTFSEDNSALFMADLGTDILYYYDFSAEKVSWNKEKSIKIEGAGPRTVTRGKPGSKLLYLSCELDNTIRVLSYKDDALQQIIAYQVSANPTNYPS